MTAAIKNYWERARKVNEIVNPGQQRIAMEVRHFLGELPTDWAANVDTVIERPELVQQLYGAFENKALRDYAGRCKELITGQTPPTNGNGHQPLDVWLDLEARLDDIIDRVRTLDSEVTNTLLTARRLVGKRIIT